MNNFIAYSKYIGLVLKHKWFVFYAGLHLKVPFFRLLIHDLSKFMPAELPHYVKRFMNMKIDSFNWSYCWLHHIHHNPHHWQYWISSENYTLLPMPLWAVREMVADWLAAGRTYNGKWPDTKNWNWFNENFNKMKLHTDTLVRLDYVMDEARGNFSNDKN